MKKLQTLIIGGGQAGLAAGWHLANHGIDFQILEASEHTGGAWRSYYDSLELFSPAGYSALPGLAFPGQQDRYPHRDEVVEYLDAYARKFKLPIHAGKKVIDVIRISDGFEAVTATGERYRTKTLIAASGAFGTPHTPLIQGRDTFQGRMLHSAEYVNKKGFEDQRVVVVGAANSAVQIATELASVARVTLAIRKPLRFFPQRLLGLDFHTWIKWSGLGRTRWLKDQGTPVLDDGTYRQAIRSGHVQRRQMFTHMTERSVIWPTGQEEMIDVVVFATGFKPSVGYLQGLGVIDPSGHLRQRNGISKDIPGLYFLGFPRQRNFASATLRGVGADAAYFMPQLRRMLSKTP